MAMPIVNTEVVARNWGALAVRGAVAVGFGVVTLIAPGLSLLALVLTFGVYAFADGVFAIVSAVRGRTSGAPWWMLILQGIAGIGAAVITVMWPGMTAVALVYLVAAWALVTGVLEVTAAIRLRKEIEHEWLLALSGLLSVALGVLLATFPGPGMLTLALWIGAYALISGGLLLGLSFRLRGLWRDHRSDFFDKPAAAGASHRA